jgi:hypothetical protein
MSATAVSGLPTALAPESMRDTCSRSAGAPQAVHVGTGREQRAALAAPHAQEALLQAGENTAASSSVGAQPASTATIALGTGPRALGR